MRHAGLADRILAAPGTWAVRACEGCRLTWLDPQPHPDDLGRLYEGAYMTHAASAADAQVSHRTRRYLSTRYGYAGAGGSWLPAARLVDDQLGGRVCWLPACSGGTVLDMGCGSGAFLARMQALGWQVAGVEPDPAAAAAARRVHGIEVASDISAFGDRTFQAITMHHVIEHLPDPHATVSELSRRLVPEGRLVIVTPNIESLGSHRYGSDWVHWDPPRHLWMFSRPSLRAVAEQAGLQVERAFTTGRYARFVGSASTQIRQFHRVREGAPSASERVTGLLFQAVEALTAMADADAGEEVVVVAVRPA